ncbi:MAG: hypothetical protein JST54_27525 [Deltaproteobacteria bacterium]|nr:hypothetical protein [Deltaproteobacteria bacterium]
MNHLSDELLQQLAEDLIEGEALVQAEAHAAECPACRSQLAEYCELFGGLESLPVPPPPPRFTSAVMGQIANREAALARQRKVAISVLASSAALAFFCFALAGNGAWARQLTMVFSSVLQLGRFSHVIWDGVLPVLQAWRLPLLAAAAAVCIPTLIALQRSTAPRAQLA